MHNSILKGKRNETIYWGFGRLWSQNEEGGLSGAHNALSIFKFCNDDNPEITLPHLWGLIIPSQNIFKQYYIHTIVLGLLYYIY